MALAMIISLPGLSFSVRFSPRVGKDGHHERVPSHFSRVQLFMTLWTAAHQAPLSMGFSRQEYWSGLPCPPPGDLPNPGIKLMSFMSPALDAGSLPRSPPGKPKDDHHHLPIQHGDRVPLSDFIGLYAVTSPPLNQCYDSAWPGWVGVQA